MVRCERPALVRPSLAAAPIRLRPRRLGRQARHRHHQHLERHQRLPRPSARARRGREARHFPGRRPADRTAGDVACRADGEAVDHDLSQFPRHGDRGAAAQPSDRRRRADGRLRQDHAGPRHGRDQHGMPAIYVPAGPALRGNWRGETLDRAPTPGNTGTRNVPAGSPRRIGPRSRMASRARSAPAW